MHPRVEVLVLLMFVVVVLGLATGVFSFTLGSFLVWGAIIGVALAILSRLYEWPNVVGPPYGWAYLVAVLVFLVQVLL